MLGEKVVRPAILDENLASEIIEHQDDKSFLTILGGTMGTDCFYEGNCTNSVYNQIQIINIIFRPR